MRLIAKKPCSYGGQQFFAGDEIPEKLVVNAKREESFGVIAIIDAEEGVSAQSGTFYLSEHVDEVCFTITVKGEEDNVTAVSCSTEDIQSVVDVLQMNADDGAKAVTGVQSDSVLILLHALDTRATVKKAAQKQHDTLFSAEGNSNESTGGNATTDSNTEGADI